MRGPRAGQLDFTNPAGHSAYWPAYWKDEDGVLVGQSPAEVHAHARRFIYGFSTESTGSMW